MTDKEFDETFNIDTNEAVITSHTEIYLTKHIAWVILSLYIELEKNMKTLMTKETKKLYIVIAVPKVWFDVIKRPFANI